MTTAKKRNPTFAWLTFFLTTAAVAYAQQPVKIFGKTVASDPGTGLVRCASSEYEEYLQETNKKRISRNTFETWLSQKTAQRHTAKNNSGTAIMTIPVVVHIIHSGDAIGQDENISDEQVLSQITVLNEDFRKLADTHGFNDNPAGADTGIEFCLAQTNPDGNATNGIIRHEYSSDGWPYEAIEGTLKPNTQWDPQRYFNIWIVKFTGEYAQVLGYAQYPTASGLEGLYDSDDNGTDGVVIGYKYFGSEDIYPGGTYDAPYNLGRTATHEIGHALGLMHVWGDDYGCTGDDHCSDTPVASEPNAGCPHGHDSCTQYDGTDMVENYMDYTYDYCMNIFTQNQKERILTVMQNSPRRASLLSSTVCQSTAGLKQYGLNGISLYPNPANSMFTIAIPQNAATPDAYTIYNSIGQVVGSGKFASHQQPVDVSTYANGIYFIRINSADSAKTLQFIKN
jgi:hypothetical protein